MKNLLLGVLVIILVGIGGFVYRNAAEHPYQQIACPLDAEVCPDGTTLSRTGSSCTFPACPPPNVTLEPLNISYAVPEGFVPITASDTAVAAAYELPAASSTGPADIVIRDYAIAASSTALDTMQATAIGGASGAPVPVTAFTSTVLGTHRYTVVSIERFEGVIDTAYYLARANDVLRFDAIDHGVVGWTDPALDTSTLPAQAALKQMLSTLEGQ